MKILIFLSTILLIFNAPASDNTIKKVQVKSVKIQLNVTKQTKSPLANEITSPTKHQSSVTKDANGKLNYQCKQVHNHSIHREVK